MLVENDWPAKLENFKTVMNKLNNEIIRQKQGAVGLECSMSPGI